MKIDSDYIYTVLTLLMFFEMILIMVAFAISYFDKELVIMAIVIVMILEAMATVRSTKW